MKEEEKGIEDLGYLWIIYEVAKVTVVIEGRKNLWNLSYLEIKRPQLDL